ncbi:hypothetical protein EVAR_72598_1 [Eumeta japonica]|uniref:Uncharacterized protein n=1 Tax=Eumeta variegata TaxID=151549 RepID=A0A4C1T0E9_EUMVA|nr:hypothetical protein EVAR_72598_1 [Eumeta japonica]
METAAAHGRREVRRRGGGAGEAAASAGYAGGGAGGACSAIIAIDTGRAVGVRDALLRPTERRPPVRPLNRYRFD